MNSALRINEAIQRFGHTKNVRCLGKNGIERENAPRSVNDDSYALFFIGKRIK